MSYRAAMQIFKIKLFEISKFRTGRMTLLFLFVLVIQQSISVVIEYLFWGYRFQHVFDVIFLTYLTAVYFHYSNELCIFLIAVAGCAIKNNEK